MASLQQRIERALDTQILDARDFQACATYFLIGVYPGPSPFTGGHDFGRDADLGGPRLLCTTGPLRSNLTSGLKSMKKKGIETSKGVVMATSRRISAPDREKHKEFAAKQGVQLLEIYERSWLVLHLLEDGYWRRVLLDVTSEPAALVPRPMELRRLGEDLPLSGRANELVRLGQAGDVIVIGAPGFGKTRLLAEAPRVAFLEENPSPRRLGQDLDDLRPDVVVVEHAARRRPDLRLLQRLREEESRRHFRIAATAWPDEAESLRETMPGAEPVMLELLEREEMDPIIRALGVENTIFRQAILEQAGGRPGWAVVLAQAATQGSARQVFEGRTLTRRVEIYLEASPDPLAAQRVLAYLALHGGVSEPNLGTLARRLELPLHTLMRILHSSTHNGVLERRSDIWSVQPEALADSLVMRWFLDADALEPMTALIHDHPEELPIFVRAAAEASLRSSDKGAQLARQYVPELTADLAKGDADALGLCGVFVQLDEAAAAWTLDERIVPALKDTECPESMKPALWNVVRDAAELYQVPRAVELLLDRAVEQNIPANLPENPIRILAEAAGRISPDGRVEFKARRAIFRAAVSWLDRDASPERWQAFAALCKETLAPNVGGLWTDPAGFMKAILSQGYDSAEHLEAIGTELWGDVVERLATAPDQAIISLVDLAGEWASLAAGAAILDVNPNEEQRRAADAVAEQMIATLHDRLAASPGLAIRARQQLGSRMPADIQVPTDFDVLARDEWEEQARQAQQRDLEALATRWAAEAPSTVLERLAGWRPQFELIGPRTALEAYVMEMLAGKVEDAGL